MTRIKCRYSRPYCTYDGGHRQVFHSDHWFCDDGDGWCGGHYTRPLDKSGETKVINPICVYCKYETGEFEKTVKQYEYSEGNLFIRGEKYTKHDILYLEIDDRVLVKDGKNIGKVFVPEEYVE